jgi:hypothetical protein
LALILHGLGTGIGSDDLDAPISEKKWGISIKHCDTK